MSLDATPTPETSTWYPQQPSRNNVQHRFHRFDPKHQAAGQGEAASIANMIEHASAQYDVDASRVYVTGLSADGAVSAVMLASYPDCSGQRPRVAIWHGDADSTVAPLNSEKSRDQWTDIAGVSPEPTETTDLDGTTLEKYGDDQVRRYTVAGMDHETPVAPGDAEDQCGTTGEHFLDTICSTYHDSVYFGLSG